MLISACIIARDEERNLSRCLPSLAGVADEIVVYDTGSVDSTVEVARSLGARVVTGSWPGGFAAARNAALEHCGGDWILTVDADEAVVCPDPDAFRRWLAAASPDRVACKVSIDNQTGVGAGSGYSHPAARLYRPARCEWRGRLHEQLVERGTGELPVAEHTDRIRIAHWGYLEQNQVERTKVERNLALARAEVTDPSLGDRGIALVWLGRALWAADRPEEALAPLLEGAGTTANPASRRLGLESAARILLRLGRLAEAAEAIGELRRASRSPVVADLLQAGLDLSAGRWAPAERALTAMVGTVRDDDGREYGPREARQWRAAALLGLGEPSRAADLLVEPLRSDGELGVDLDLLAEALRRAGRPFDELAPMVPASLLPTVVAGALRLRPDVGNAVLEGLWGSVRAEDAVTVLAGAAMLGQLLDPAEAGVWSERLHAHGLGQLCPLRAVAADPAVPPRRRREAELECRQGSSPGAGPPPTGPAPAGSAQTGTAQTGTAAAELGTARLLPAPDRLLSVVLVAHGGAALVHGCLASLSATLPDDLPFEVVVVDPGSTDGTSTLLAGLGGDVTVVRLAADPGPAAARNVGAACSTGATLVFVHPASRPQPGWLEALLDALGRDRELGMVAAGDGSGARITFGVSPPRPALGLADQPWSSPDMDGAPRDVTPRGRGTPRRGGGAAT